MPTASDARASSGDAFAALAAAIDALRATLGVVGLGYVGLPLAAALHRGGYRTLGFDIDPRKIEAFGARRSYLSHLDLEFAELAASVRFEATGDFTRLAEADIVFVCVPTPLGAHQEPDLSFVKRTGEAIGRTLRRGQLVVLTSTSYPGTTRDEFQDALVAACDPALGLVSGRDFFVAFSPEREDPGRKSHSTRTIPRLVGGLDEASTDLAGRLLERCVERVVRVRSAEVAEAAKLLENVFRAVNIALVNELKVILGELSIDVWDVIEAASSKPFGFMPFYPGPGLGGHCIPIDPFYLAWKAREVGRPTRFIELAGAINTEMPGYVIDRLMRALNRQGKPVRGSRVLLLGVAYKENISDTRESPSFELLERLRELGATVAYSDPYLPRILPVRKHDLRMESVELTAEAITRHDAVIIATAHAAFDYELLAEHARLVVDTRNAMRDFASGMGERLVKA